MPQVNIALLDTKDLTARPGLVGSDSSIHGIVNAVGRENVHLAMEIVPDLGVANRCSRCRGTHTRNSIR